MRKPHCGWSDAGGCSPMSPPWTPINSPNRESDKVDSTWTILPYIAGGVNEIFVKISVLFLTAFYPLRFGPKRAVSDGSGTFRQLNSRLLPLL